MSLFEFVRTRLDILEIIGRHVQLKKMGNYWKGPCPFHKETDASFTVSPDKGIFYCFGCHQTGDAISFTAKINDLSQIEALDLLVDQNDIAIPPELRNARQASPEFKEQSNKHFLACKEVALWANKKLKLSASATKYLNNRGICSESIERFTIGMFPASGGRRDYSSLTDQLGKWTQLPRVVCVVTIHGTCHNASSSLSRERSASHWRERLGCVGQSVSSIPYRPAPCILPFARCLRVASPR